jgi:hypothetical protein
MKKKRSTTLSAGLKAAMAKEAPAPVPARKPDAAMTGTQMIGAHYSPMVRRTLMLVQAETGRNLKQLLGEAINDLCAKYGKPQPYRGEE